MSNFSHNPWEHLLSPTELQSRLIRASVLITAYELLKDSIHSHPLYFFASSFDKSGPKESDEYKSEVRARHKNLFEASSLWLVSIGALDKDDLHSLKSIADCRNALAHKLMEHLHKPELHPRLEQSLIEILRITLKLEVWWQRNVDVPIGMSKIDDSVLDDEIVPGKIVLMRLLIDIGIHGSDEYLRHFRKAREQ